jgi:uncharacterized membrane protein YbhN (UPF0104 family)
MVSLATMVPLAPANLGLYEAAVFAAYRFLGLDSEPALGLALCQHACFLLAMIGPGYLGVLRRYVGSLKRRGAVKAEPPGRETSGQPEDLKARA